MSHPSPLEHIHHQADPLVGHYGPSGSAIQVIQAFDPIEVEYAAIRRHAAVLDLLQRATLIVSGDERLGFLNRMVTQDLKAVQPYRACSSFWLSRKGRIDADLRIILTHDQAIIDCDVFAAQRAVDGLRSYIITEDCRVDDVTAERHRLSLHGPGAAALLARLAGPEPASIIARAPIAEIAPNQVSVVRIAGAEVIVDRRDTTGEIGLELLIAAKDAQRVYEAISTPWSTRAPHDAAAPQTDLARRIGWHAYNIARIEAGTPLYLLDFGPDSLPHETGDATLADHVSFKKGCYLGQEIVARMQSLGHPKQKLVGLRITSGPAENAQPETGTPVHDSDQPGATVVGAVTSSAFSPMNGGASVCFAMVKFSHATAGKPLFLQIEPAPLAAVVQPTLSFLQRA